MIFFDNASTTKLFDQVNDVVNEYNMEYFYNPSAIYGDAFKVQNDIKNAKNVILNSLGAKEKDNFIFTSCATESNNTVLRAFARKNGKILVSQGEHPSVYNTALDLKNSGYNVEFLNLTSSGKVDENDLRKKLTSDVNFVSIIHINNETGVVNDIAKLTKIIKSYNEKIIVHSDGVQAFGKIPVNVTQLGVDFYTISGHKIHAPKGIAGLFVAGDRYFKPLITGGGQQDSHRNGTENVSGIMAMACASEIATNNLNENYKKMTELSEVFLAGLDKNLPYKIVTNTDKSPYINMIVCSGCRAETLVHMMEERGVIIGNGSACSSKKKDNRNLSQMGYNSLDIEGAIRVSFSSENTVEEVNALVSNLNECVKLYLEKVR